MISWCKSTTLHALIACIGTTPLKDNLDIFDLPDTGLENVQLFVEDTCPLLGSNSGHLPLDLRVIVNRFVMGSLKKEAPEKANKKRERGHGEQSTPVFEETKAKRAKKPTKDVAGSDADTEYLHRLSTTTLQSLKAS